MTYIFEDGPESELSRLIKLAYPDVKIRFSSGNDRLVRCINEVIHEGETNIAVFIDIIPGNSATASIYNLIVEEFITRTDITLDIAPIICVEYYLMMDLDSKGLLENREFVQMGLNIDSMVELIINSKYHGKKMKTFEKQCKKILNMYSTPCLKDGKFIEDYINNGDCNKCSNCPKNAVHRALDMMKEFPYTPKPNLDNPWYSNTEMSRERYIEEHNKVIGIYNSISNRHCKDFIAIPLLT